MHSATKVLSFYAYYEQYPRIGIEPQRTGKLEPVKEFTEWMKEIHEEAGAVLSKASNDMIDYTDQHRGSAPKYKVDNKVWLSIKGIKIK